MYLYRIGYGTAEACPYKVLISVNHYTEDQFNKLVIQGLGLFLHQQDDEFYEYNVVDDITFERIYHDFIEWFPKAYSFKEAEFAGMFNISGWAGLTIVETWDQGDTLIQTLRDELCKIGINKRVRKQADKNRAERDQFMKEMEEQFILTSKNKNAKIK